MESDNGQVKQLYVTYHPIGAAATGHICDIDVIEHVLI